MNDPTLLAEVHWYSSGLRHQMVGWDGPRPEWVPPPEWVGMRNDETLQSDSYAVEFQRISYRGQELSWLAVYRASLDLKFGDRGNHAGIGIWMHDQWIKHGETMLNGLRQLTDLICDDIAAGNEPENVASHIANFLGRFAPMYLRPENSVGSIPPGLKAGGALGQTKIFGASGETPWRDTGERIETLAIVDAGDACRVLVRIGGDTTQLPAARPEDVTGHILDFLPRLTDATSAQLTQLEAEKATLSQNLVQERAVVQQLREQSEELQRFGNDATARANDLAGKLDAVDSGIPLGMQNLLNSIAGKVGAVEILTQRIDGMVRNVAPNARPVPQPLAAVANPNILPQEPTIPGYITGLLTTLIVLGIGGISLQLWLKDNYAPQFANIQAGINKLAGTQVEGEQSSALQNSVDTPSTQSTSPQTSPDLPLNGSSLQGDRDAQRGRSNSSINGG